MKKAPAYPGKSNHATLEPGIPTPIFRPKINSLVLLLQCSYAVFGAKRKNNNGTALLLFFRLAVVLRA